MPTEQAVAHALSQAESASPSPPSPRPQRGARGDRCALTPREREVAALVARGLTNRQIAAELVITEGTAANHVEHILHKLGFRTRAQIGSWAAEHGLSTADPD